MQKVHMLILVPGEICYRHFSHEGNVDETLDRLAEVFPEATPESCFVRPELPDDPALLKELLATAIDSLVQQRVFGTLGDLGKKLGQDWTFKPMDEYDPLRSCKP